MKGCIVRSEVVVKSSGSENGNSVLKRLWFMDKKLSWFGNSGKIRLQETSILNRDLINFLVYDRRIYFFIKRIVI